METKALVASVITALVTAIALGILGFFMGVFERGTKAMSEDQIEAVIERVLVTDTGATHAAALSRVNGTLIEINTKVGIIQTDVDKLESAMRELASQ